MTHLNKKLLTIYLALGTLFFIAVIYLFVKNEVLPKNNSDVSHKIRLTSVRVIKNNYFENQLTENNNSNTDEETMAHNSIQSKKQSYFLLVNETDNATYAKSSSFYVSLFETPFSVEFQHEAILPLSTLNNKYRLELQEDGKRISSFNVPNLNTVFALSEKSDTVTAEKTIQLISLDKKIILFLIFTID